jgi:DNA-binding NarL/FixJ family response regulator
MLIKGISPTKIASKKKIALTTVSTYKTRIYKKLNVNNIIDMATKFNKFHKEFIHD